MLGCEEEALRLGGRKLLDCEGNSGLVDTHGLGGGSSGVGRQC